VIIEPRPQGKLEKICRNKRSANRPPQLQRRLQFQDICKRVGIALAIAAHRRSRRIQQRQFLALQRPAGKMPGAPFRAAGVSHRQSSARPPGR